MTAYCPLCRGMVVETSYMTLICIHCNTEWDNWKEYKHMEVIDPSPATLREIKHRIYQEINGYGLSSYKG